MTAMPKRLVRSQPEVSPSARLVCRASSPPTADSGSGSVPC
ncbi:MAG: hypothetical protein ACRDPH_00855 [Marmoricola sp.]